MVDYPKLVKAWLDMPINEREGVVYRYDGNSLFTDPAFIQEYKKQQNENTKRKYYYLVTFTLKPGADEDAAHAYVLRVPERSPLQIIRCDYVKELTKKGVTHWHMSVETTKALKTDRFSYYAQKFGHVDVDKNRAQIYDEMVEYMTKTNKIKKLK